MIFDDIRAKEPINFKCFCRDRHSDFNVMFINQNLFSLDRQNVRENCNLFILFKQRGSVVYQLYKDYFNESELGYSDFANICTKVWKQRYSYLVLYES